MTEKQIANMLREIKDDIKNQIGEARNLLRFVESATTKERAKSYWLSQIETALDNDHDWLGGSMCTMEDTINELDYEEEELDEDY